MKFKSIFSVFLVLLLFLSSACASPSESSDEELNFGSDFMRGFDASMVSQLEEYVYGRGAFYAIDALAFNQGQLGKAKQLCGGNVFTF